LGNKVAPSTPTIVVNRAVSMEIHTNFPKTMLVVTKVHVLLRRYVVLTWMHDNRELV